MPANGVLSRPNVRKHSNARRTAHLGFSGWACAIWTLSACTSSEDTSQGAAAGGAAGEAGHMSTARGGGGSMGIGGEGAAQVGGTSNPGGSASGTGGLGAGGGDAAPCLGPAPMILVEPPLHLSEVGLYSDTAAKILADGVEPFEPTYKLWSDGAEKHRWVRLPPCGLIDTADMDHWNLPVGFWAFKEFVVDQKRIETRVIHRFGEGPSDFWFAPYAWNDDETEAEYAPLGKSNAKNTAHDIPTKGDCNACHGYLPERLLGFSAIQLSHDGEGATFTSLVERQLLTTHPPKAGFSAPGSGAEQSALGYLHANCGGCHNPVGVPFLNPFVLRLSVNDASVETTGAYTTALGIPVEGFAKPGVQFRIEAGNPEGSCIYVRSGERGNVNQMPPLATEFVDEEGHALLEEWITNLAP